MAKKLDGVSEQRSGNNQIDDYEHEHRPDVSGLSTSTTKSQNNGIPMAATIGHF
ncbi:MAG: hypothetical protein WCI02_14095 [Planctomycetota bacterium]|jgi:hypothetical protein